MLHILLVGSRIQQHGSKYFACRPPTPNPLEGGVKRSKFNLSEHDHVAFQIKANHKCSNMVANILFAGHPYPRSRGQNSTFSVHGHVTNQIKGNHECSNMVAYIWPTDSPPTHLPLR